MMAQTYGQQIKSTQRERSGTGFRMMGYSFRKSVCILLLLRGIGVRYTKVEIKVF